MKGSLDPALKQRLKELIVTEADKDLAPASITDEEVLFGHDSQLQLDSIDGLQISMALQLSFGEVVDAATAGDFSRRVKTQFADDELNRLTEMGLYKHHGRSAYWGRGESGVGGAGAVPLPAKE